MRNQWGLGIRFVFVTTFFVAITSTCLACFEHERLALLKFKHSVKDPGEMLASWVGNDCCGWERVMCDAFTRHVKSLHLRCTGFYDFDCLVMKEVDFSLGQLTHLKYLDLSGNDFKGSEIPEFIGSLKELTYLNLSNAYFYGMIPPHIGNLSNLKCLDLHSNSVLMARDMVWISGLSSLEHLDLSSVNLGGAKNLDKVLFTIPSLKDLSLSQCGISNDDLGQLRNLSATLSNIKRLDLSDNLFEGQLPQFFQNLTSLQFLDLSSFDLGQSLNFANFLSRSPYLSDLHLSFCNLTEERLSFTLHNFTTVSNIQQLDVSKNFFPMRFPSILANMTSLRALDISDSSLNSSIPTMPNLLKLDLSFNNFKQLEDVGIWRQCHLQQLSMMSNEFLMEWSNSPTSKSKCSHYALERLDLTSSVKGKIPESLEKMTNLKGLHLSRNNLTGPIPTFPRNLTELYVSNSYMNGSVPESLGKLRLLQVLDLSHNELTGPIPPFHGELTKLDLSFNNLNGSIPEFSKRLSGLSSLFLDNNKLTGPIPMSLGRLVSLQTFVVSSNFLSGAIPISIGQLSKLYTLDVSNNYLEGEVFEAHFYNLSMLKDLDATANKLTFNISHEWLPPFQLITVDLSSCKIANGFPGWLRNQKKLYRLNLSNTTISGPLPTWLQTMPIIPIIKLSHNNLSGPLTNLPTKGTSNDEYSTLFLQDNLFNESIPKALCNRTDLRYLDLSKNKLTGKIPKCLKNLQMLRFMILSSNGLSGVIPGFIGHISSLVVLNLNENKFSGKLPREYSKFSELTILDLGDNALYGKIPAWIGENVQTLSVLRLHKNNFTGRIPQSLCKNSWLQILDVAHNNLIGTIPGCLGELRGMTESMGLLADNPSSPFGVVSFEDGVIQIMKGIAMEYTKTLKFLINMDLSSNKLVGEIPREFTALSALVGLNLSNNHLSGGIPKSIGNMTALNSLDFSGNDLSGLIPPSIASLSFLSHLNLSNNNFSGQIPTGNQLQTLVDPSIYAGNKDLCGAPLPKNCSNQKDPTATPKNKYKVADKTNKVWFYLDIMCGFATGFWGVIIILTLKKQWRHKFFMFAEETMDKIHVAVMIRVNNVKRGGETI